MNSLTRVSITKDPKKNSVNVQTILFLRHKQQKGYRKVLVNKYFMEKTSHKDKNKRG